MLQNTVYTKVVCEFENLIIVHKEFLGAIQ